MLSTLRVASRSAAAREANMRTVIVGARQASAWSKVPQGPPVSLPVLFPAVSLYFRAAIGFSRIVLMQWTR